MTITNKANQKKVVVIGGTGKTGRRIVQKLEQTGVPVRSASRHSSPAFDWNKHETWSESIEDGSALYIAFSPDLAVPGAPDAIRKLTLLAREKGVKRLVLLSGRGEEKAQQCEQIVLESGLPATVVRASWFSQNFSEGFLLDAVKSGKVMLPVGDVREPFVDVDDIADVAFAALTEDGHEGRIYEVTGPRLMTFAEATETIASKTGQDVDYLEVSIDDFCNGMSAQGVSEDAVSLMRFLFSTVLDGRNSTVTDGIQKALGRPPRDFEEYAASTSAMGVWNQEDQNHAG